MSERVTKTDRRVLIIGADGLRPDQVTPESMPTYCQLMQSGALFQSFHSAYPSLTRVCMATLTTGVYPGRHGVMGNLMFAPGFSEDGLVQTGDHRELLSFRERTGVPFLLSPTLGDRLAEAGMRLSVSAGSSPGASLIWNFHHPELVVNPSADYDQPALRALHASRGPVAEESDESVRKQERVLWATKTLIERQLPDENNTVMVLWLPEPDETQHQCGIGSREAKAAQSLIDRCLADILRAIRELGMEDQIDLLLLSDHGHSSAQMVGSLSDYLEQAREELGLELDFIAADALVYGDESKIEELTALAEWLLRQPWCGMVLAKPPLDRLLPNAGPLEAAIGSITHHRAPLLAVVPARDEAEREGGLRRVHYLTSKKSTSVSYHGSLHYDDMHPFCMGYGPSFKQGHISAIPAGIVDIAPTVCHLLGLTDQGGFAGRVLSEGLRSGRESARTATEQEVRSSVAYANAERTTGLKLVSVCGTSYVEDCF